MIKYFYIIIVCLLISACQSVKLHIASSSNSDPDFISIARLLERDGFEYIEPALDISIEEKGIYIVYGGSQKSLNLALELKELIESSTNLIPQLKMSFIGNAFVSFNQVGIYIVSKNSKADNFIQAETGKFEFVSSGCKYSQVEFKNIDNEKIEITLINWDKVIKDYVEKKVYGQYVEMNDTFSLTVNNNLNVFNVTYQYKMRNDETFKYRFLKPAVIASSFLEECSFSEFF